MPKPECIIDRFHFESLHHSSPPPLLPSPQEPTGKGVYVDYLYAIPESVYNWEVLEPLQIDRSAEFLQRCGPNHYQVDTSDEGA